MLRTIDRLLTAIAWCAVIALWLYAFNVIGSLPDTVPIHFNLENEADNWGSKHTLWLMPILATVIVGGFQVLKRYPEHLNYAVAITESNKQTQHQLAFLLLSYLAAFIPLLFLLIIYSTVRYVDQGSFEFPIWLVLGGIFGPIVVYFVLAYRAR